MANFSFNNGYSLTISTQVPNAPVVFQYQGFAGGRSLKALHSVSDSPSGGKIDISGGDSNNPFSISLDAVVAQLVAEESGVSLLTIGDDQAKPTFRFSSGPKRRNKDLEIEILPVNDFSLISDQPDSCVASNDRYTVTVSGGTTDKICFRVAPQS